MRPRRLAVVFPGFTWVRGDKITPRKEDGKGSVAGEENQGKAQGVVMRIPEAVEAQDGQQ